MRRIVRAEPGEYVHWMIDGVGYRPRRRFLEVTMENGSRNRSKTDPNAVVAWIVSMAAGAAAILGVIALAKWIF